MKQENKKMVLFAIIGVVVLMIVFLSYFFFFNETEKITEDEQEVILDDQISPYTNQGLTVQILRIRHRGLLEKMMGDALNGWISFDQSWKEKPSFYYATKIDGKESTSKGSIGADGTMFHVWDTICMECRDKYFIEEEQETSDVTISIIEVFDSGLFKRKSSTVIQEEIRITYDFRTGRWTGDDYLKDDDGYGHYLGETFEVWFNLYQTDFDNDNIPYWTEVNVLGTDPTVDDSQLDPDNDGIPTAWEWNWGYDPFTWDDHRNLDPDVDGIQNSEEYKMRKWFANPYQPDVFVEVDYMEKKNFLDLDHILHEESKQMVIERLAQHGINCYIDDGWSDGPVNGGGEMLPFMEGMPEETSGQALRFYKHNFADERKGIFRYVWMANIYGYITAFDDEQFDAINIGTGWDQTKLYVGLKPLAFNKRLRRHGAASGLLHELGHSMGLIPVVQPGVDIQRSPIRWPSMNPEEYDKYLENYHSIMNYQYIYRDKSLFDYSDGSNGAPYDINDWEHLYLPCFEKNTIIIEEPSDIDHSFEDIEVVNDYPGVILKGWRHDKDLTMDYNESVKQLIRVKNTDSEVQIFVKNETVKADERSVRIYAKPNVDPFYAEYVLIAEGWLDSQDELQFFAFDERINQLHP
ncbi:MAG: hypothetical protein KGY50_01070 [Candidatus Thermoplasmatota archaeon]|nr:hypothetical protein [Candidatus Thermoplasmatota archaeon]